MYIGVPAAHWPTRKSMHRPGLPLEDTARGHTLQCWLPSSITGSALHFCSPEAGLLLKAHSKFATVSICLTICHRANGGTSPVRQISTTRGQLLGSMRRHLLVQLPFETCSWLQGIAIVIKRTGFSLTEVDSMFCSRWILGPQQFQITGTGWAATMEVFLTGTTTKLSNGPLRVVFSGWQQLHEEMPRAISGRWLVTRLL